MNYRALTLSLVTILLAFTAVVRATGPTAYEPFNYTTGTFVNGTAATGTGFAGNWTCGAAGTIVSGLAYSNLPVANNALSSGGARQYESLSTPLSSGTKWISFLLTASANMGGNVDGVFFPNNNTTCLWFGWGLSPYSPTQGGWNIGSMTTAGSSAQGATSLLAMGLGTYASNSLIVLRIDFNTSGANDTVTIYTNPVAGASAPGVAAAGIYSNFDVGTISGVGLNVQGAASITVDEIRVGNTYGDVVGYVGAAPAAPTGLTATPGTNQVSLGWTGSSGATSYNVKRGTASAGPFTTIGTTTAPTVTYTDSVLGGQTYYYVVSAVNGAGESANSSPSVSAAPTLGIPAAPTGVTTTPGTDQVSLGWTGSSFAASYNVKRGTASAGPFTTVGTTTAPTVTYTDSVLGGQTYYYVVSAVNGAGESANSSPSVSAAPTLGAPATPTGLGATAGNGQVALTWNASTFASSYNLKRSTTSGTETLLTNVTTTSFTDAAVVNGTTYYYVVSATNAAGESANSSETNAMPTGPTSLPYEPFNYTTGTLANGTATTATGFAGNWTCGAAGTIVSGLAYSNLPVANNALSSGGARQYESFSSPLSSGTKWISFLLTASANMGGNVDGVFFPNNNTTCLWFGWGLSPYSPTQGGWNIGSMTTAGSSAQGATSLLAMGLGTYASNSLIVLRIDFNTSGANDTVTIYTNPVAGASAPGVAAAGVYSNYDVGTISGVGLNVQGGASITVDEIRVGNAYGDVVGYAGTAPSAPTGLTATPGVNQVSLGWTGSSGATSYNVKRGTASAGPFTTVGTTTAPTVAYTDSVLGGQTYYYVVSAVNGAGESANSSPSVSAAPTLGAPATPTGLGATAGNGQVALTWNASTFASSYNLKRSTTSGSETLLTNLTATSFTDTAVVNGTTYYYVVSATNAAGESANSSEVNATPLGVPSVPTGVTTTPGANQVVLSWTASTGSPASYNVKRGTASAGPFTTIGTTTAPTVAYTDSVLGGQTYYYVVSAVNGAGESANSSPSVSAAPTLGAPAAPTGLGATPGTGQVALTWNASTFASSYNLKRSTTSGSETTLTNITATAYTDSAVVAGTNYYYKVSAVNGGGESANSSEVSATPTGGSAAGPILYNLNVTGSTSNRLNFVIMGDGYTTNQVSQFTNDAQTLLNSIFSHPPYSEYTNYFNVYAIFVASVDSGASHPESNIVRNTYFGSTFDTYGIERLLTISSAGYTKKDALEASLTPFYDLDCVVVNDQTYGGSGGSVIVTSMNSLSPEIVVHESGHTLGNLGDEYSYAGSGGPGENGPNITQQTNRTLIKWNSWINASTPIPTPDTDTTDIGLFQGANYDPTNWYRPKYMCEMQSLGNPFCSVCSEALVKAIYSYVSTISSNSPATNATVQVAHTGNATFTAVPQQPSTHSLSIQWYTNSIAISGATSSSYTLSAASLGTGTYSLKATILDPTPLVRSNPDDPDGLLTNSVTWSVQVLP